MESMMVAVFFKTNFQSKIINKTTMEVVNPSPTGLK